MLFIMHCLWAFRKDNEHPVVKSKLEEIFAYRVLKVNEILIQNNDKTESIFFLVS
jgi:ribosomal protein L23